MGIGKEGCWGDQGKGEEAFLFQCFVSGLDESDVKEDFGSGRSHEASCGF